MDKRVQNVITNLTNDVRNKFQDQNAYLQTLTQLLQEYESVGLDLIQLKIKYTEVVKQYSTDNNYTPSLKTFPGVVQTTPSYSPEKMQADSKQLLEMGKVINDLENQKELIYSQIRQTLEAIVVLTTSSSSIIDQVSLFLSQTIEDVSLNGTYGSPTLKSLVI